MKPIYVYISLYIISKREVILSITSVKSESVVLVCVCVEFVEVKVLLSGSRRVQKVCVIVLLKKKQVVCYVILIVTVCKSLSVNVKFECD